MIRRYMDNLSQLGNCPLFIMRATRGNSTSEPSYTSFSVHSVSGRDIKAIDYINSSNVELVYSSDGVDHLVNIEPKAGMYGQESGNIVFYYTDMTIAEAFGRFFIYKVSLENNQFLICLTMDSGSSSLANVKNGLYTLGLNAFSSDVNNIVDIYVE